MANDTRKLIDCGKCSQRGKHAARGLCQTCYAYERKHGRLDMWAKVKVRDQSPCSIPDCDQIVASRGWCQKHYTRWTRHGDPTIALPSSTPYTRDEVVERFWKWVDKTPTCWVWIGARNELGYGQFTVSTYREFGLPSRNAPAHRFAYVLDHGSPPAEGLHLDHLCRNPWCVRPSHLEAVTPRENVVVRGVGPTARNARKTHCKRGHEFTDENTYISKRGYRNCRTCHRDKVREQNRRGRS